MSDYQVRPNHLALGGGKDTLTVRALGSGIVVCLYDEHLKKGGMLYTLFPDSAVNPEMPEEKRLRYVDTGLQALLAALEAEGLRREALWAKVIGGAKIFQLSQRIENEDIGKQNVEAARKWLREKEIPIKAEDTGDSFGRTVCFFLESGTAEVKAVNNFTYRL